MIIPAKDRRKGQDTGLLVVLYPITVTHYTRINDWELNNNKSTAHSRPRSFNRWENNLVTHTQEITERSTKVSLFYRSFRDLQSLFSTLSSTELRLLYRSYQTKSRWFVLRSRSFSCTNFSLSLGRTFGPCEDTDKLYDLTQHKE